MFLLGFVFKRNLAFRWLKSTSIRCAAAAVKVDAEGAKRPDIHLSAPKAFCWCLAESRSDSLTGVRSVPICSVFHLKSKGELGETMSLPRVIVADLEQTSRLSEQVFGKGGLTPKLVITSRFGSVRLGQTSARTVILFLFKGV